MRLSYEEALNIASHSHFKGGLYLELGFLKDSSNGDYLTDLTSGHKQRAYLHLYPNDVEVWMRDEKEWEDYVPMDGMTGTAVLRFKSRVGKSDVLQQLLQCKISRKGPRETAPETENTKDGSVSQGSEAIA